MPDSFSFEQPGTCYVFDGVGYEVLSKLGDGQVTVRNLMTLEKSAQSVEELRHQWQAGHIHFALSGKNLRKEPGQSLKTRYAFTDLSFLPKGVQYETWLRYTIIMPLLDLKPGERTRTVILHRVAAVITAYLQWVTPHDKQVVIDRLGGTSWWGKYALKEQPGYAQEIIDLMEEARQAGYPIQVFTGPWIGVSYRSVYRWLQNFEGSRHDIRALVPVRSERGPKKPLRLTPLAEEKLKEALAETYNSPERPSVQKAVAVFHGKLVEVNQQLPTDQQLPLVGKDTVYRIIARLDPEEVDSARFGQEYAERAHHQSELGPRPTRPNERWEIDHSPLDLLVIDEVDWLPIGRPTFTSVIDRFSFYPPGFSISFEPASYLTVMDALFYSIIEKDFVKPLLGLQHDYLPFGVPERLACDNAPEFRIKGRDLQSACVQLGIEIDWMPRRKPWFKPGIERWYGTANTELIHDTPGTTFSNFLQRGDYDPSRYACITLNGLWYLLHRWIVDIYAQNWRRGGRGSFRRNGQGVPAKLWENALAENFVPHLPPSRETLLVLLGRTDMRTVQSMGIEFECLYYNSHKMDDLRSKLHGESVVFKYNPSDLSRIWVLDPFSKTYLEVEACDKEYTRGLSLWKHKVIRRYIREEMKRQVDQASLAAAKYQLHQLIREEFRLVQKMRTRKRMARFLNLQVARFMRGLPDPQSLSDASLLLKEEARSSIPKLLAPSSVSESRDVQEEPVLSSVSADLATPLPPPVAGVELKEPGVPEPTCIQLPETPIEVPPSPSTSPIENHPERPLTADSATEQAIEPPPTTASPGIAQEQLAQFGIEVSFTRPRPA